MNGAYVIGFTGKAGSGKSFCAEQMASIVRGLHCLGKGDTRTVAVQSLSDPIKSIAKTMGWNGIKDDLGRLLLQRIGTECGRECISEDIWITHMEKIRRWAMDPGGILIIDDVRFENEAEWVRENGVLIHVQRPGHTGLTGTAATHASEAGVTLGTHDEILPNDPEYYEHLKFNLKAILEKFEKEVG